MSLFGPYIGPFSVFTQKKVRQFVKRYGNNIDIKLIFSSLKMGNIFYVKDPIPRGLRTCVVYKFLCAGRNAYVLCRRNLSTFIHTRTWTLG